MKINRKHLLAAIKAAGVASDGERGATAELKCVELSPLGSNRDGLQLRTTTLTADARIPIAGEGDSGLARPALVNFADFAAAVTNLPGDELDFYFGEDVVLTCGVVKFKIPVVDAPMPKMVSPDPDKLTRIEMPTGEFVRMTGLVVHAAANSIADRSALRGICLDAEDGNIVATACDGRRLATAKQANAGVDGMKPIIVHADFVRKFRAAFGSLDAPLTLTTDGRVAQFTVGDFATLTTRLVDEVYPNWRQLRVNPPHRVQFSPHDLSREVKRVKCVCGGDSNRKMKLDIRDGAFHLRSIGERGSCGVAEVDAVAVDGTNECDIEFYVNPDLLCDALDALNEDDATFGYSDHVSAFEIRSDGEGFTAIVMPLRA